MDSTRLRSKRVIIPTVAVAVLGVGGVAWASTGGTGLQSGEADRAGSAAVNAVGGGTVTEVESDDEDAGGYEVEVQKSNGTKVDVKLDKDLKVLSQAAEDKGDDDRSGNSESSESGESGEDHGDSGDRALGDSERASAEKAALAAVGGGTVTEVEAGDEGDEAYEVDIRKADGTEWEVKLDSGFQLLQKSLDD